MDARMYHPLMFWFIHIKRLKGEKTRKYTYVFEGPCGGLKACTLQTILGPLKGIILPIFPTYALFDERGNSWQTSMISKKFY
ncbi:hypothetical protein FKM82_003766 [Ascaphus truei]